MREHYNVEFAGRLYQVTFMTMSGESRLVSVKYAYSRQHGGRKVGVMRTIYDFVSNSPKLRQPPVGLDEVIKDARFQQDKARRKLAGEPHVDAMIQGD